LSAGGKPGLGDYTVLALGFAVFALVFNSGYDLVYSMAVGSTLLASIVMLLYRGSIRPLFRADPVGLAVAPLYALALHVLFYLGAMASEAVGLGGDVATVYSLVRAAPDRIALLALISAAEEVYWRGGVQESLVRARMGLPWWVSPIPYSIAHVPSGITILVPAALVAGLVLGMAAHRHGLIVSTVAHYLWLLLAFHLSPY
jgi:hypothetical protein